MFIFKENKKAFTLIETFVAITVLSVAVVAPMSLVARSLSISYYVRDEITASYLAQEAVEVIRDIRDDNMVTYLVSGGADQFADIPIGSAFTVDARMQGGNALEVCGGTCEPVAYNGEFYGRADAVGSWVPTRFTRTVVATFVDADQDDLRLEVTVEWRTGSFQTRTISITEHLYRWIQ